MSIDLIKLIYYIGDEKDAVKKIKRKKVESSKAEGSKAYVFQTRTSPKMLFNALQTLRPVQKACLEQMGFEGLLDMKLDGIPSKIGFYVVDQFNPDSMEIKLRNSSIYKATDWRATRDTE